MKNKNKNHSSAAHKIMASNMVVKKVAENLKSLKSGFTLIELLIVIAIIGILAVSLLPSILGAPASARDAARKADLTNMVAGIESFYAANGRYPDTSGCIDPAAASGDMQKLNTLFKGGKAPTPPNGTIAGCANQYLYCKLTAPNSYYVAAKMEKEGSTKGYRAAEPGVPAGDACAAAAAAADASGLFYLSIQ